MVFLDKNLKPIKMPRGVRVTRATDKIHKYVVHFTKAGRAYAVAFGAKGYEDWNEHKNSDRRENYLKRSAGIRDKIGRPTKDDPTSANYWSRRLLWGSGEPW